MYAQDRGYGYLRLMSRDQAIAHLSTANLGAFLLRPYSIGEDSIVAAISGGIEDNVVFYISFKGLPTEVITLRFLSFFSLSL